MQANFAGWTEPDRASLGSITRYQNEAFPPNVTKPALDWGRGEDRNEPADLAPGRPTTVLLVGDFRYTLTFARSLARSGYRVVVARTGFLQYARYSRFTSAIWEHPRIIGDGEAFGRALAAFVNASTDIDVVLPLGDREVVAVARHAAKLPPRVRLAMPEPSAVSTCTDKAVMCRLARELDIPQAPFAIATNLDELFHSAPAVGFPCIVKSAESLHAVHDEKAVIVRDAAHLREQFREWPKGLSSVLVQRFAPGPRHNVQLLAHRGELVCRVQTKTLRTDRPNYTGYTVEAVTVDPHPAVDEHTRRLLGHLGYSGLGCLQFLIDEHTGSMSFLELNPRLGAAFVLCEVCGIDFPRMAAELAIRGNVDVRCPAYTTGKRMVWSYGDIDGIIRARDAGTIGRWEAVRWLGKMVKGFLRADAHATWSWRDPKPTIVTHTKLLLGAVQRLLPGRTPRPPEATA